MKVAVKKRTAGLALGLAVLMTPWGQCRADHAEVEAARAAAVQAVQTFRETRRENVSEWRANHRGASPFFRRARFGPPRFRAGGRFRFGPRFRF